MSPGAIVGISYGVIALGVWRWVARSFYYEDDSEDSWGTQGKFASSLFAGLLFGAAWPLLMVFAAGDGIIKACKWLGQRNSAGRVRAGLVILFFGRPPDPNPLEEKAVRGELVEASSDEEDTSPMQY